MNGAQADFFYQDIPVFNLKIPYKDHTPYRYTVVGYRRQLYHQTICRKDSKKHENYIQVPWSFANWISPSVAAGVHQKRLPSAHEPEEPPRHQALTRAAEHTHRHRRDEAVAVRPSAGDAPQTPPTLDPNSRTTTTKTAAEASSRIHTPNFHQIRSYFYIHKRKERHTHLPTGPASRCWTTPVQGFHAGNTTSTSSPSTPEWSIAGARKSLRGLILLRRRRLRLNADARRPNPRSTRTKHTTYVRRPGTRSLGHLPTALKPSEAEETAVPGGGDEIGFSPLSLSQL